MNRYRIILSLLMTAIISGTVSKIDFVGSTVSILTADQHQMSFFVPGNAIITRETHDIGLMDIKEGHPVTIKYDISSSGRNSADSIVDNNPTAME